MVFWLLSPCMPMNLQQHVLFCSFLENTISCLSPQTLTPKNLFCPRYLVFFNLWLYLVFLLKSRHFSSPRTDFLSWPYLVSPAQGCFLYFKMKIPFYRWTLYSLEESVQPANSVEPGHKDRSSSSAPENGHSSARTSEHGLPASANQFLGTAKALHQGLYWPGWMQASCFGGKGSLRV